jgi:hypothetical protein
MAGFQTLTLGFDLYQLYVQFLLANIYTPTEAFARDPIGHHGITIPSN